jgi:dTDP-4-dehydrorhamnose reductase
MAYYSKLLITGGSGFLGWNLAKYAAEFYEVSFTYGQHPISIPECQKYHVDLQNRTEIEEVMDDIQPEVLIHTAALGNVELCEKRRSLAHEINVAATSHLAKCAEELGCRFVYISTDLVFDGQQGNYVETDRPIPVNYYGETKLLGEKAVMFTSTDYLIIRMALMYGISNGINGCFTDWIRKGLENKKPVHLYTDQYRSPLFVLDGVQALIELIEKPIKNKIFHLAGRERLNRYDFGKRFAKIFGYSGQWLRPTKMQDVAATVPRGNDCSLNPEAVQKLLSFQLSDVHTGLQQMKKIATDSETFDT